MDEDTTCSVCYAEFIDVDDLKNHVSLVHKNDENYENSDGEQEMHFKIEFVDFQALDDEFIETPRVRKTKKILNKLVPCNFCDKSFVGNDKFVLHLRDFHLLKLLFCKYCLRAFSDGKNLKKHQDKHISIHSHNFSCSNCDLQFSSRNSVEKHEIEDHHHEGDGVILHNIFSELSAVLNMNVRNFIVSRLTASNISYVCHCRFHTIHAEEYIKHSKKSKCMSLVCDTCHNTYKLRKSLIVHVKMCRNDSKYTLREEYIKCTQCKEKVSKAEYGIHIKKCCTTYSCCSIKFNTIDELAVHKANKHAVSMELKRCRYCFHDFVGMPTLIKHMLNSHKNYADYKYDCAYCSRIYSHPKKLFGHIFTQHRDIKPFKCNICDVSFRLRQKFTVHIKIKHNSIGFIESTENFHVNFNENKCTTVFHPQPRPNLFNSEEEAVYEVIKDTLESSAKKKEIAARKKPKTKRHHDTESSDEEPLLTKKMKLRNNKRFGSIPKNFTCNICKKYCYTYQNYLRHTSMHYKYDQQCIKCLEQFPTEKKLKLHMETSHPTAQITQTLKSLLEKRKLQQNQKPSINSGEKIRRTIKKIEFDYNCTPAIITPVKDTISVKNFLENFVPDDKIEIASSVTFKVVEKSNWKPTILLTACKNDDQTFTKLKMPEPFAIDYTDNITASVEVYNGPEKQSHLNFGSTELETEDYFDQDQDQTDYEPNHIPEVAEEVVYENVEPKMLTKQEIVLSEATREYGKIKIATFHPVAPYYKIVPLETEKEEIKEELPIQDIKLPMGKKLVNVNPLAHLIDKDKLKLINAKKRYRPKITNPQQTIAKALMKLNEEKNVLTRKSGRRVVAKKKYDA